MRSWRLTVSVIAVLVIGISSIVLADHSERRGSGIPDSSVATPQSPAASDTPSDVPDFPGIIRPASIPEFNATFVGSRLDSSVWSTCYPSMNSAGCTNFGNAHTEDEWYLPSQDQVYGGLLHLVAQRELTPGKNSSGTLKNYECRSGMVTSYPGFQFEYGYVQIVARIPTGAGLWPALWLAAANLRWPPEMDMIEAWGGVNFYAASYFHFSTLSGNRQIRGLISPSTLAIGWHIFSLSWTSTQLTWMLDGKVVLSTRQHIPHQKMYIIADLAEAISRAHSYISPGECDGSLLIRSVKVWKA